MSSPMTGYLVTLAGSVQTSVSNISNITNSQTRETIDITAMDNDGAGFREFVSGMADAGELTFTCNYEVTNAGYLESALKGDTSEGGDYAANEDGKIETWTVTFPDTSNWACKGFVTSLGHAIPLDDKITQDVTIKLTGKPTFTDAPAE